MTKIELEGLLKENGYVLHPFFKNFFYRKGTSTGYLFNPSIGNIQIMRIYNNSLNLKEGLKEISYSSFNPFTYLLKKKKKIVIKKVTPSEVQPNIPEKKDSFFSFDDSDDFNELY